MLDLFKRKKVVPDLNSDKAGSNLATKGRKIQIGIADWMGQKTSKISIRTQKLAWSLFIGITGCYCIYLMTKSVLGGGTVEFNVQAITKPSNADKTGAEIMESQQPVSEAEYDRIMHFRKYMDSLATNTTGKEIHDSIITNRPGLMDSLEIVENYYQSYHKN